jgi:hypothetical protein
VPNNVSRVTGEGTAKMESVDMLWLYIAAAGAGTLLGLLRLRVLAVLAGSVVLMSITILFGRWSLLGTVVNLFLLLATLQFSYLGALLLSSVMRIASRDRVDAIL